MSDEATVLARRLVMDDLEKIREAVRDQPIEDTVLDVMDVVSGWVSPHRKLEPPDAGLDLRDGK